MSGETQVTAGAKSEQVKAYLESTVVPVLTQALTQMCISEPDDPFNWLAQVRCVPRPWLRMAIATVLLLGLFCTTLRVGKETQPPWSRSDQTLYFRGTIVSDILFGSTR
jgi:hypothetical protein